MKSDLTPKQIVSIGALYGLYACLLFIGWFLLMRLIGMATVVELRFFNYVLLAITVYYAARKAESYKHWRLKYLQAFIVIFATGFFSFIYFGFFILNYSLIDPFIINTFSSLFPGSAVMGKLSAPFLIASEGISITSIISLSMAFFVQEYSGHRHKNSGEIITLGDH
ncbi:MAG: hypothetical protein ABI772_04605 [Bacteroidota bacterium]